MYDDAEARKVVRELVKRLEVISAQSAGLAMAVVRKNPKEYERLLESAGRAVEFVVKPLTDADSEFKSVYTALDEPESNWCEALHTMLKSSTRTWWGDEAMAQMEFVQGLISRFEEEERKAQGRQGDPGFAT